jgi:hypothetical protein
MNTTTNWIAAFVAAVGLGAAILNASAVASADPGTPTMGPTADASHGGPEGDYQSERRRATFAGASVTEVKLTDFDAGNNKK